MKLAQSMYQMLMEGARAHAKWEYEMSMNILKSRKRMIILCLLAIPAVLFAVAFAADPELPKMLGSKTAYAPAFYDPFIFWITIVIGLVAGLITGCIGAGGGFVITPALMSAGIKGILAVGTDLFHIFAKAIMGTAVHKKLGNVSVPLALWFLVGSGVGVTGGGIINRALYDTDPLLSEIFISIIYVLLLGFLGIYSLMDFLKSRKSGDSGDAHGGGGVDTSKGLPAKLQSISLPPFVSFDHDLVPGGKRISVWFVAACGAVVGFVAAIMGVGGGFLTFPMFIYILGVSSFTTVGTDILQIIFTAGYAGIFQYAIYGFIFYTLAMGMLLGSLMGIQLGALTTRVIKGIYIRGFYAIAIIAGFINRLFALPEKLAEMKWITLAPETGAMLSKIGSVLFFIAVAIFAGWIIFCFIANFKKLREA